MPKIFDNINEQLLPTLQKTLDVSYRADFCVGYFNLRGWKEIDEKVEAWTGGEGAQVRLLVGMQRRPEEDLRVALSFREEDRIDNQRARAIRRNLAEEFRKQLTVGSPSNADEAALQRLLGQLKSQKLVVKLFMRHPLHAKLYLLFRSDEITPIISYLGSSNLTFSGLAGQGELTVDVVEQDAAGKLEQWFAARWGDQWCVDISADLIEVLEESWAAERLLSPYHIYLKMAYHLSREARAGLTEFAIPSVFGQELFEYQVAAVKIAARHLNERHGVLIGDVVGLGKTIMATAVAKIFEEDYLLETLIICPKNLVKMWQSYVDKYFLKAKVISLSMVQQELPGLRRYRLVLIDESHNLRNREGKRFKAIQEYIQQNDSRVILLTATPYNKAYTDLGNQLRLFIDEQTDLGIRPEQLLNEIGEVEFSTRHQAPLRSLAAFEKSEHADDWRELLRLFMVRRTRTFIRDNYALTDTDADRKYLLTSTGERAYFPNRHPRRLTFALDENNPNDQYSRMYADSVVDAINALNLSRYGLGQEEYVRKDATLTTTERKILDDLSRGGKRLMGFSRTNLFKRLESSGHVFLLSIDRHILRNEIFVFALENNLPIPIGTQNVAMLDSRFEDDDAEAPDYQDEYITEEDEWELLIDESSGASDFRDRAEKIYRQYERKYKKRFKWLRPELFTPLLKNHLQEDSSRLLSILNQFSDWDPAQDTKLNALEDLLQNTHGSDKVLIFSQFADTVAYLSEQLEARGLSHLAGVTGSSDDPTQLAWRFSPYSNEKEGEFTEKDELRVLVATDVLSEGQNLQDAHVVVNYDLPWAIIRLIQRAGRVDRIGQQAPDIFCYTFWPAEGVERIIRLRDRLLDRLRQNQEVVGSDEAFFEGEESPQPIRDLYNERPEILDDEVDTEVDLVSHAYQIWKNAVDADPDLEKIVPRMPNVVFATKAHAPGPDNGPAGVLVYIKDERNNSALAWIDQQGNSVTESQFAVLRAAACRADTPPLPRMEEHHEMVRKGVQHIFTERRVVGGQLGRPSGARFKTYTRLKSYADRHLVGSLFENTPQTQTLLKALDLIYRHPLRENAAEKLNRQMKSKATDEQLAELLVSLYDDEKLCNVQDDETEAEPEVICSMGLAPVEVAN